MLDGARNKKSDKYSFGVDIWSLGITALELGYGKPPYSNLDPIKVTTNIIICEPPSKKTYGENKSINSLFDSFVSKCLIKNVCDRPTAKKLLKHKFIKKYAKKYVKI